MLGRRGIGRAGRPSLVGTAARTAVVVGTATAVAGRVEGAQQAKAQQQAQAAAPPPATPAPPPPPGAAPTGTDERITQLTGLAQLHQQGVLTADEFAEKALRILGL